jgi:predicted small lipoprotein YifL
MKYLNRSRLTAIFAVFFLFLLAGCGPASAPPPENPRPAEARHEEPRQDEPRQDEARRDEANRDESRRRESKSERRRRREKREASGSSQTSQSAQTHDLSVDETQGGHTLSRHVGRSDADLQERLQREGNISAASTYTDRTAAEAVVGQVLEHNSRVEQWEQRGARRPNLALDYHGDASQPIGRCMQRGSNAAVPAWDAIVVLKASRDGDGFYVLTSYPECPR